MIYYKFPCSEDFNQKFTVYKGGYTEIFVPTSKSGEKYCYAELPTTVAYDNFVQIFGGDGEVLKFTDPDWPNSNESFYNNRHTSFTILRPFY
jgi:hypothetical protein